MCSIEFLAVPFRSPELFYEQSLEIEYDLMRTFGRRNNVTVLRILDIVWVLLLAGSSKERLNLLSVGLSLLGHQCGMLWTLTVPSLVRCCLFRVLAASVQIVQVLFVNNFYVGLLG